MPKSFAKVAASGLLALSLAGCARGTLEPRREGAPFARAMRDAVQPEPVRALRLVLFSDANAVGVDPESGEELWRRPVRAFGPPVSVGDAVVEAASTGGNGGYGHMVLLNHEFGYKTRYAHLSKILVQPGERVVRGQIIAETGNTGISSGPHLHYEVIHKGVPVNPINYFNRNMTSEEYEQLMENMRETNFEKL